METKWNFQRKKGSLLLAANLPKTTDELFEDGHLEQALEYRLAFREFGTCLGIKCYYREGAQPSEPTSAELLARAEEIIAAWEKYIESATTPEDLRPITRVMYATALVPGGELTPNYRFPPELLPFHELSGGFDIRTCSNLVLQRSKPGISALSRFENPEFPGGEQSTGLRYVIF